MSPPSSKVGIITGGASGMGLETAKLLAAKGWKLHLFDMNEQAGRAAVEAVPNSQFHAVDVTKWDSIAGAFDKAFNTSGTIDFVFANAGIVERFNFYAKVDARPPPPPDQASIDINLKGVVNTTYLAQHYFRSSPHGGKNAAIIMTASCGGLYPIQFSPLYAGAKAGVINFMRSVSFAFHHYDGIRTYAICPGTVRTNLLKQEEWDLWPESYLTPVSKIASTVDLLLEGGNLKDSTGKEVSEGSDTGLAVEVNGTNHYFRDPVEFCDEAMKVVMENTSLENHVKRLEG